MVLSRRHLLKAAGAISAPLLSATLAVERVLAQDDIEPADLETFTVIGGGLDTRPPDLQLPGDPENADVFIIARLHLPSGRMRAISVPRDLYVEIPGFGYDKITRAYDHGSKADGGEFKAGSDAMKAAVSANFGVEVDAVAVATFEGFVDVINTVEGVDVDNPYDLYDAEYPTPEHGIEEIFFPAGSIHLDGQSALKYVRTRHQDGDGGRIMRQHLVLMAMLEKTTSPEYADRLPDLVHKYRRVVRNDIGASRRLALALAAPRFSTNSVEFSDLLPYVYSDTTSAGMWIYSGDWSQIPGVVQEFLAGANS
jgi:LCP family protein required for cell wall assembly